MKMKKMFKQFIPVNMFSMPLTLIGSMITILWIFSSKKSHWIIKRKKSIKETKKMLFKNLLGSSKTPWKTSLFSLFLLCLSYNLISLIPYTFSQTSHLSMTFSLSIPIWLAMQMTGFKKNWKKKMSHLLPQSTPMYLIPLMMIIETVSLLIQPMTLGFRLGAKILAGHLLMFLCSCTMWKIMKKKLLGFTTILLIIILLMLEMAVACMQAAVFLMLSKNYLEEKTKK